MGLKLQGECEAAAAAAGMGVSVPTEETGALGI